MAFQLFIAEQIQSLQRLRQRAVFLSAPWIAKESGRVCSAVQTEVQRTEMLQALQSLPCYPKWFWQDRDQRDMVIAWGQTEGVRWFSQSEASAHSTERDSSLPPKYWCFFPFDPQQPGLQVQAEVEIRFSSRYRSLTVQPGANIDSVIAALRSLLVEGTLSTSRLPVKLIEQRHCPTWPQWQKEIEHAQQWLQHGQLDKVVLARKTTWKTANSICPYALLLASTQYNAQCYHWLFAFSADQTFISATPERLLRRRHRYLTTEALAGTSPLGFEPKGQCWSQWLIDDDKNNRENQWVAQDIQQQLAGLVESFDIGDCELLALSSLQHLRRPIRATLHQEVPDRALVARLSPTAAVAGYPRSTALDFIRRVEPFERQWYAGCFGYYQGQHSEFTVAIRCAEITPHQIDFYAGAGIVEGSDAEQEWHELDRKLTSLTQLCRAKHEAAHG
ncbi:MULTISPECIES: isochorismate synthase MenF [unclassified Vibrio]|uniref:isochorismate synthase n=1 Tax=Vibrio sp. HB236076 TaxID=3232307 RepID=A0AB39HDY1_9VIBR|nr:isochorismate synthase [Vibrio sp. HB161653]MDP5253823.1 isochorismate synthase [Vibrio sp. HB161653]